ncbi:N-6 DNA methylase [Dickeya solani]|uniref:N-6 DNA methylase n=1 Tax=Dickeya solani TaxID=1089444 RepID=A0AAX4F5J7_9GAMM|nr:N-6 DNA methylase [Dickeya solani]WOA54733.1 N-6 DNA methylase [Dickeya solani]
MHATSSKKSDYLGRYFTNERIGQILIDSMQNVSPGLVLDLGAGDGALTAVASKQWSEATFMTVDIDLSAASRMFESTSGGRFSHTVADALCHDLPSKINISLASADVAICNPPFIRPKWHNDFQYILQEAGLDDVLYSKNDISAELLFIAQNLRLLKTGGVLGLILPDGIISGEKNLELRKKLLECHAVESVIELPRGVFRSTDAKTHILVLRKHGRSHEKITLQRVDENNYFQSMQISITNAFERLDFSYHFLCIDKSDGVRVGDVSTRLVRGNISSKERKLKKFPVFHTSDMVLGQHFVPFDFFVKSDAVDDNSVVAINGDILISRVGRNLVDKICMVKNGSVVISDCIILIRIPNPIYRDRLFSYLLSEQGKTNLNAFSHGVGASFLTQKAISNLIF